MIFNLRQTNKLHSSYELTLFYLSLIGFEDCYSTVLKIEP